MLPRPKMCTDSRRRPDWRPMEKGILALIGPGCTYQIGHCVPHPRGRRRQCSGVLRFARISGRVHPSAALKTGTRPFQRTRSDGAVCRQTGAVTAGSGFPRTGCFGTSITALRQCTRIEPSPRIPADGLEVLNDR